MSDRLRLEVNDNVAVLTFADGEHFNLIDEEVHEGFPKALDEIAMSGARAAVLAAEGPVFCAGGDVAYMRDLVADPSFARSKRPLKRKMIDSVIHLPIPMVCALQGDAFGLGASVVLSCDAIVASRNAGLADTHVNLGHVAGDGGCVVWPAAMGLLPARRYLLTGDRLDAERAYSFGIVSELVDEPGQVLDAALALATRMAELPPLAVQGTKRALSHVARNRMTEVFDLASEFQYDTLYTDDLSEALSAFKERRQGKYVGR